MLLELELEMLMSHAGWMLGVELGFLEEQQVFPSAEPLQSLEPELFQISEGFVCLLVLNI